MPPSKTLKLNRPRTLRTSTPLPARMSPFSNRCILASNFGVSVGPGQRGWAAEHRFRQATGAPVNGEEALLTTAEVAITLAGFTGIVAVLGRRGHGEWQPQEQLRLAMLLVSSFAAVLFAMLPIALLGLRVSEAGSWAISSAVLGLSIAVAHPTVVHFLRRLPAEAVAAEFPRSLGLFVLVVSSLVASLLLLNVVGFPFEQEFGPYFLGLLWLLALSAIQFVRLLAVGRS